MASFLIRPLVLGLSAIVLVGVLAGCAFRLDPQRATLGPASIVTNPDDCKDGGWRTLLRLDGSRFENQGECVSYANTLD